MYRTQMEEALLATECVNVCDLTELKSLKAPPVGVKDVMNAVCILHSLRLVIIVTRALPLSRGSSQ